MEAKRAAAEKRWKEDVEAMTARQAAEFQKHVEVITKAAALEDVELPRRLVKYRYRPSPQLTAMRETLASLGHQEESEEAGLNEIYAQLKVCATGSSA